MRTEYKREDFSWMTDAEFNGHLAEARKNEREVAAKAAMKAVFDGINHGEFDVYALADAIANEHPTLLGQVAKAMGIGIMRRADYNPDWRPYAKFTRPLCRLTRQGENLPDHPEHDGRLDCSTVVGGEMLARQSYI